MEFVYGLSRNEFGYCCWEGVMYRADCCINTWVFIGDVVAEKDRTKRRKLSLSFLKSLQHTVSLEKLLFETVFRPARWILLLTTTIPRLRTMKSEACIV